MPDEKYCPFSAVRIRCRDGCALYVELKKGEGRCAIHVAALTLNKLVKKRKWQ